MFPQGGVSDDVSLTAYITAAMLELDANVTVSLTSLLKIRSFTDLKQLL